MFQQHSNTTVVGWLRLKAGWAPRPAYEIRQGLTLGRSTEADVPLVDTLCSRRHCRVEVLGSNLVLRDLGSTNGTQINGRPVAPQCNVVLRDRDRIQVGHQVFEVRLDDTNPDGEPALTQVLQMRVNDEADTRRLGDADPHETTEHAALEGDLERMGFAQVVQLIHLAQHSGVLEIVERDGRRRCVAFDQGQVRDASGSDPRLTFLDLCHLPTGRFSFYTGPAPTRVRVQVPTLALLLDATRVRDEATRLDHPARTRRAGREVA
jgi:pSer/pThr/pTyr-binding forkhead associated (FHA) protein